MLGCSKNYSMSADVSNTSTDQLPIPLRFEDELALGHIGRLQKWIGEIGRAHV